MTLAGVESPSRDEAAAAAKELDALSRESTDFAVVAASIARAALLWTNNAPSEAQALMKEALAKWRLQQPASARPDKNSVEEDVSAIREVVFKPTGGSVYAGGHWNAFSFPSTSAPFLVINPGTLVRLPSGEQVRVRIARPLPGLDNVLFFDPDQLRFFGTMMTRLGGTKKRQPTAVMETPNQPIGPSLDILALVNQFFPARPGHWGGWEFETYPRIDRVEFLNVERTQAVAAVTVGYSGASVVLEKKGGVWIAVRLTNEWMT
jgi:hypothetical protein